MRNKNLPFVTNANIYAPVMMIAEKAADLIRGVAPLQAEEVPYYVADGPAKVGVTA